MDIEVVLDAGATIGESPTWVSAEKALYWIDVKKPALYRYDPAAGDQRSWPMPDDIDAFARVTYSLCDNDTRLVRHALDFMRRHLQAAGAREIWNQEDDTCHLNGTARMGDDPRTSVVNADCRCWDIPNLWICDGSVFPTVGGVNPSLTIQAIACRTADRIEALAARGELSCGPR